ncbi:MAG TPA: GtrA family protein [Gaiellales bacterium]|jgi:dolichol-phosphate mannosyltransferase|nr:GtrA family protein [Gaiellales bacterium]
MSASLQRVEREVTDEIRSMTVRVITYEMAPAGPPAADGLRQVVRFCLVGGSGYLVNLLAFHLADAAMPYIPAFALAFLVAATSNFLLNRWWTFAAAGGSPHRQFARFLCVSAGALALDLALLTALVELAGAPKLAAAALAIAAVTPVSFLANKHWSFDAAPAAAD